MKLTVVKKVSYPIPNHKIPDTLKNSKNNNQKGSRTTPQNYNENLSHCTRYRKRNCWPRARSRKLQRKAAISFLFRGWKRTSDVRDLREFVWALGLWHRDDDGRVVERTLEGGLFWSFKVYHSCFLKVENSWNVIFLFSVVRHKTLN